MHNLLAEKGFVSLTQHVNNFVFLIQVQLLLTSLAIESPTQMGIACPSLCMSLSNISFILKPVMCRLDQSASLSIY